MTTQMTELMELVKTAREDIKALEEQRMAVPANNHGNSKFVRLSRKLEYKRKLLIEVLQDIKLISGAA